MRISIITISLLCSALCWGQAAATSDTTQSKGIHFADQYSNLEAAQANIGTTNPAVVVIPPSYSGRDCPKVQNNVVYEDYRAGGRKDQGTSSFICTNNIIQYNTKTPGGTDAMVRAEMSRRYVDRTGSIVAFYPITHLQNGTGGSTIDGDAPLAEIDGTLTGTQGYVTGSEQAASIQSTGGSVATAIGAIGYVTNGARATTPITNAYGLWGRGCQGTISGVAPANCYGGFFSSQRGAATQRNYAVGLEGLGLLMYDGHAASGGFDCEDAQHVPRPCFRTGSNSSLVVQAISDASGVYISDASGAGRYHFTNTALNAAAKGVFTGGVVPGNQAAPACDASHRGVFWYQPGGPGAKDVVEVCAKDAADAFAWRRLY